LLAAVLVQVLVAAPPLLEAASVLVLVAAPLLLAAVLALPALLPASLAAWRGEKPAAI
jgi:hypothetical protein